MPLPKLASEPFLTLREQEVSKLLLVEENNKYWIGQEPLKKVELVEIVASLVPAGATRRIDEPRPSKCSF